MKPQLLSYFTFNHFSPSIRPDLQKPLVSKQCLPIRKSRSTDQLDQRKHSPQSHSSGEHIDESIYLNSEISVII